MRFYPAPFILWLLLEVFTPAVRAQEAALPPMPPQESGTRERSPWILAPGEQRRIKVPGLKRYSLGGTAVRALRLSRALQKELGPDAQDELLIKAVAPGRVDLWLWSQGEPGSPNPELQVDHQPIEVTRTGVPGLAPALSRTLGNLEETEIIAAGQGVVLRGEVRSAREAARVAALARAFPKEVRDETEPSAELLDLQQQQIAVWLKRAGLSNALQISRQGPLLRVHGSLERPGDRERTERAIQALCPWAWVELQALPDSSPVIHFQVFLLELKKTRVGSFGLSWPALQEGAFRVTGAGIAQALDLPLAVKALESEGSARVLSNPELAVRAPGEAELFAGGELPVRTTSQFSSQVTWRNFGLTLRLKVTQATAEKVRLEVQTEVSHLDPELDRDSLPGIQANRIRTQVDAELGKPLFLSGMLQQDFRKQARGLPFLRQIPILGSLFGSEDYLNDRSELVAVLLPQAQPPSAPMERFGRVSVRGRAPAPRNWISPSQEQKLKSQADYPWNALQ
jgi:Flp pilus assembly secretin CpaC